MASVTPVTSLSTATTGNGTTVDFETAKRNVSAVIMTTGTVTAGAVGIQVSHDGTNWVSILDVHLTRRAGNKARDFSAGAYRYWRSVILRNVAGGGTVTVTFMEAG